MTDFEANLEEIQGNISSLQENDAKQDATITGLDKRCADNDKALGDRCTELESKNNFLGSKTDYTTADSNLTVTLSLGDMDAMREKYSPNEDYDKENDYVWDGRSLSVSKAVMDLDTRVKKNKKDISILGIDESKTDEEKQFETDAQTVIEAINELNTEVLGAIGGLGLLTGVINDLKKTVEELEKKVNS